MAVVATRLMFQVASRAIAGNLGGKPVHCMMRPAQGGALPPAGDYEILPPVSDPIYGRLALMAPAGQLAAIEWNWTTAPAGGLAASEKYLKDAAKFWEKPLGEQKPDSAGGGGVFVLSDRPVLGRNCIVVSSGFADLMDALQTSGGARVTVA
jgi:hypothetical protein